MMFSVWTYPRWLLIYGQTRVRFCDFLTAIYGVLHLQSERPWRGWIHLFDALNLMVVSFWPYDPYVDSYSEKRFHFCDFLTPSTEYFIYSQNIIQERRLAYSMC